MTMNLLPILVYPDERLRVVAQDVVVFDETLKQLADDLIYTMQENNGIGLAATQCGINKRIIVAICNNQPRVFINPEIIANEGEYTFEEGCLSVPGYFADVTRSQSVSISYQRIDGTRDKFIAFNLDAVVIQHEIEHLDGKLFVDHLSKLKQTRALQKVKKTVRERSRMIGG